MNQISSTHYVLLGTVERSNRSDYLVVCRVRHGLVSHRGVTVTGHAGADTGLGVVWDSVPIQYCDPLLQVWGNIGVCLRVWELPGWP